MVPPGGTTFTTQTAYYHNRPVPNIVIIDWEDNFGFPRFDLASSTSLKCRKDAVPESNGDEVLNGVVSAKITDKPVAAEVYPNPSSKNFRLYLSFTRQQNIEIDLYNIDGKQLYRKTVWASGIIDIDASNYNPGVYILKVRQGEFNKTFKLIRQ